MGNPQPPDTRPGNYYVTWRESEAPGSPFGFCLGPFKDDHAAAIARVDEVRAIYAEHDPGRTAFTFFGTARAPDGYDKPAVCNRFFPALFGQPGTPQVKET